MKKKAMFTLQITLRDNRGYEEPLSMAIDLDQELSLESRSVSMMKAGMARLDEVFEVVKVREMRKDLFIKAATRLGYLLAERMEDAEGWNDASRIEPARRELGVLGGAATGTVRKRMTD